MHLTESIYINYMYIIWINGLINSLINWCIDLLVDGGDEDESNDSWGEDDGNDLNDVITLATLPVGNSNSDFLIASGDLSRTVYVADDIDDDNIDDDDDDGDDDVWWGWGWWW